MDEFKERIASFLRRYVELPTGESLPAQDIYLAAAIKTLIDNEVMTKKEIKEEALEEFYVIIPDCFFP